MDLLRRLVLLAAIFGGHDSGSTDIRGGWDPNFSKYVVYGKNCKKNDYICPDCSETVLFMWPTMIFAPVFTAQSQNMAAWKL